MMRGPIEDTVWAAIEAEFSLPSLERVRARLTELDPDPDAVLQQLVRVFISDGTYCPGFQFEPGGMPDSTVTALFSRAMELKIAHNHFSVWMVTPSRQLAGRRPVDLLSEKACLMELLDASARLTAISRENVRGS